MVYLKDSLWYVNNKRANYNNLTIDERNLFNEFFKQVRKIYYIN